MKYLPSQRTSLVLAAVPALALGLAGLLSGATGATEDSRSAAAPKPALTVTTVQPQLGRLPIKLAANGSIAAWQEASIGSEANGLRLSEVRANVGDVVRAGQLLAVFAPDTVQADHALAQANLHEAEATAADAAGNAERARTLQTSGALSTQQINQYLTAEKTARARVDAAQAMLAVQQLRLRNTRVLAPDSGTISARSATVGAVLPSGTELFRMIRQGRLEWRAEVTSAELGRLGVGTTALVTTASGVQIKGRVRMVAPTVDPQTRSALVYVDLPAMKMSGAGAGQFSAGPPQGSRSAAKPKLAPAGLSPAALDLPAQIGTGRRVAASGSGPSSAVLASSATADAGEVTSVGAIKPGMFARGEFALGDSSSLMVPQTAVIVRDGFSYVYRLGDDNRVAKIKVQTGRLSGDQIEITSALSADLRLVASGAGFLNDGDLVRVVRDGQPVAAADAARPAAAASK